MSISYKILDSSLKLEDVLNTLYEIGVEAEFVDKGNDYTFYIIGNDTYGWIRMYVEGGIVTEFHKYGGGKSPIAMLFNCFNFIAFIPDDSGDSDPDEHWNDLVNLPAMEFFKKHYVKEYEAREFLNEKEEWFEEVHPDLHAYITSLGRTFNSYRFDCAYRNNVIVSDILDPDVIADFIYERAREDEEDLDGLKEWVQERKEALRMSELIDIRNLSIVDVHGIDYPDELKNRMRLSRMAHLSPNDLIVRTAAQITEGYSIECYRNMAIMFSNSDLSNEDCSRDGDIGSYLIHLTMCSLDDDQIPNADPESGKGYVSFGKISNKEVV